MVQRASWQTERYHIASARRHAAAGREMSKVASNVLTKGRRHIKGTMLLSCLGLA